MCGEANMGMKNRGGGCMSHIVIASKHKTKTIEKTNLLVDSWKNSFSRHLHQGLKWAKSSMFSKYNQVMAIVGDLINLLNRVPKVIPSIRVRIYSLWAVSQFTYSIQFSI
jgi:hypothetical protein